MVLPSIALYLPTQYHQVPTSTVLYWPSTIVDQTLPTYTDPLPPSTNKKSPILTQYHHGSTSIAYFWPSTTKYRPVLPSTDPVPPSINQYQPILLLLGDYRLLHSLPRVLFLLDFAKIAQSRDRRPVPQTNRLALPQGKVENCRARGRQKWHPEQTLSIPKLANNIIWWPRRKR